MAIKVDQLLEFTDLVLQYQAVRRVIEVKNRPNQPENDVEHSYHMAMLAWFVNDAANLGLRDEWLLKYALAHDFVEVFAGDSFYEGDSRADKHEREAASLARLETDYPLAKDIWRCINDYENRTSAEAIFIYELDKLAPLLLIYLEGGRTFHNTNVQPEVLIANKRSKITKRKEVAAWLEQMIAKLQEHPEFFPPKP
jgi:putative hydrolase of HD superfamily